LDFLRHGWSFEQGHSTELLREGLLDGNWNFLFRIDFAEIRDSEVFISGQW